MDYKTMYDRIEKIRKKFQKFLTEQSSRRQQILKSAREEIDSKKIEELKRDLGIR